MNLEDLKALNVLSNDNIISSNVLEDLLNRNGINIIDYKNRMKGIEKEYEFTLLLEAIGEVEKYEKYDESTNNIFNSDTVDYKVEMKNSEKYLIEVKSKNVGNCIKFGKEYLKRREDFAAKENSRLIFAVCFFGYWMAFDCEYIKSHNLKISLSDASNSILYDIFHLQTYMFINGTKFKSIFSKKCKSQYINHSNYGGLISEELYFRNKKIYRCKGNNSQFILYSICLEALKERMFDMKKSTREDNGFIIEELEMDYDNNKVTVIQESEMLLSQVYHTIESDDNKYNIINEIRSMNDKKEKHHVSIIVLRNVLRDLHRRGLPIYVIRDCKIFDLM